MTTPDPHEPHRAARYYQLPPRKRRWPLLLGFAAWGIIGILCATAWGAYSFVDTTLGKATSNELVKKAKKFSSR